VGEKGADALAQALIKNKTLTSLDLYCKFGQREEVELGHTR